MNHYRSSSYAIFILIAVSVSLSCSRRSAPAGTTQSPSVPGNIAIVTDREEKKDDIEVGARDGLQVFLESSPRNNPGPVKTSGDKILESAKKYMGVPHCLGGTTVKCMDCSGLIFRVFSEHGILLPHNAREQSRYGDVIVKKTDLIKGDLVFFSGTSRSTGYITHSGIYAGNNSFIHTSSSRGVIISSLSDGYWKNKFVFGTRLLQNDSE